MNSEVTSKKFYTAWKTIVEERKREIVSLWNDDLKAYTNLVIGSDNSIVLNVAKLLGLHCYNSDYYSIDSIFYCDEDLVPGIQPDTWWFRDIRIAFENENNFDSGLFQEVSHLLITDCDLRVLVTYPNGRKEQEMEYLHKVISGNRSSKIMSEKENVLLIFGYGDPYRWEGHVYKEDGWKAV